MFITFEGIEGSGKGTAISRTAEWLKDKGHQVLLTREPGGSSIGQEIRSMLLNVQNNDLVPTAELFLYLADRAQHVGQIVVPALARGEIVISDRFADSTIVYQGYGRGLDTDKLYVLNDAAVNGLWPELTILLDLPVEFGVERARRRNKELGIEESEGRFEAESLAFHSKVRNGYLEWANRHPERICVVDATGSREEVFERIKPLINKLL